MLTPNQRLITALIITLILSGCSSSGSDSRSGSEQSFFSSWFESSRKNNNSYHYKTAQSNHSGSAEYYLKLANQSKPPQQQAYQIMAAEKLIDYGNHSQAEVVINSIDTKQLNSITADHVNIVRAEAQLGQNNFNASLHSLNTVNNPEKLPYKLSIRHHEAKIAGLTKNNQLAEALRSRIILNSNANYRSSMHQYQIWDMVNNLSLQQLTAANNMQIESSHVANNLFHGWVELGLLTKRHQNSELQFNRAFKQWEEKYPNHPGANLVNKPAQEHKFAVRDPQKLALLLPIQGEHQHSSKIIRDGFFANYYQDKYKTQSNRTVKVYDTSRGANQAYMQAVNDRADIIIGPLTKQEVVNIAQQELSIPVIALNTTPKAASKANMYQFGLVPELEVAAVVRRAKQSGMSKALILVPDNAWGQRLAQSFSSQWQRLGGTTVEIGRFGAPHTHNEQVKKLLKIQDSNARAQELEKILGTSVQHSTERRQDIDVVFMAMPSNMARQVKPLLNFYYARDLPVFATSSIYSGKVSVEKDRDLDGIIFCDMPWLLDNNKDFGAAGGDNLQGPRLYALGMDAYLLVNHVSKLSNNYSRTVQGATGLLSVDDLHRVVRRPVWAKFVNGKPQQIR